MQEAIKIKILKNKKGASSVMVIMMLIVLTTLGAFAIVSSNMNKNLGEAVASWNKNYYALDSYGEEFLMLTDSLLNSAEKMALSYMEKGGYLEEDFESLPADLQSKLKNGFAEKNLENANSLFQDLYSYYSKIKLDELKIIYPDVLVEGGEKPVISENFLFSDGREMNLKIKIQAEPITYSLTNVENYRNGIIKTSDKRYTLIEWNEWQRPRDHSDRIDVWGGYIP